MINETAVKLAKVLINKSIFNNLEAYSALSIPYNTPFWSKQVENYKKQIENTKHLEQGFLNFLRRAPLFGVNGSLQGAWNFLQGWIRGERIK